MSSSEEGIHFGSSHFLSSFSSILFFLSTRFFIIWFDKLVTAVLCAAILKIKEWLDDTEKNAGYEFWMAFSNG